MATLGLSPKWAGEFKTFEDWLNYAQHVLTSTPDGSDVKYAPYICVDSKGRRCWSGAQFMRARNENTFPIRYFWDMEQV